MKKVKNITLAILIAQLIGFSALASDKASTQSNYAVSPIVGTTAYALENTSLQNTSKGGITFGIALQKVIDNYWELEGGINYFETFSQLTGIVPTSIEVKNLGILLKSKYYFNKQENEVYNFYFTGALTPSFVLSSKAKNDIADTDLMSDTNKLGLFANLGVGTDINFDGGKVNVDLTYSRALNQFNQNIDGAFAGWQLAAGYSIQL